MYFGGITFPLGVTRRPENNSPLRSMRIEFYFCRTAKTWRPCKGIQNEIFSAKRHDEDLSFTKKMKVMTREQGKEEASEAESEMSKVFGNKSGKETNIRCSYKRKQTFFLLPFFTFFLESCNDFKSRSFCCNLKNGVTFVGSPLTNCYVASVNPKFGKTLARRLSRVSTVPQSKLIAISI